ncbi:MAG TPA: response regulator transcription factor [Candidatus Omnitrophota bacterium]|nr:response regulator transcription factor [Candidatus Omnitrophota bacterium]
MKEKILIVDDEKDIVRMLDYNLKKEGFRTVFAFDGEEALEVVKKDQPDLILLDLMLPGMDGYEVAKGIKSGKKSKNIPIIMLTAKSQEADKVIGLELGTDDYVTKPFSPREALARIKAVLRRSANTQDPKDILKIKDMTVDLSSIQVWIKGKEVSLTSKEFELLVALIKAGGRVLSRDFLLDNIWGFDRACEIQTRTVDVHIRTLRKKLKDFSDSVITVKNYGYRFKADDD